MELLLSSRGNIHSKIRKVEKRRKLDIKGQNFRN